MARSDEPSETRGSVTTLKTPRHNRQQGRRVEEQEFRPATGNRLCKATHQAQRKSERQPSKEAKRRAEETTKKKRFPRQVVRTRRIPRRCYHGPSNGVGCKGKRQNGIWQDVAYRSLDKQAKCEHRFQDIMTDPFCGDAGHPTGERDKRQTGNRSPTEGGR